MMFGSTGVFFSDLKPGELPIERRKHRRVPVRIEALFLENSHEIEGHTFLPGTNHSCHPGRKAAWLDEQTFCVELQHVRPDELNELEELVEEFDEAEEEGGHA
jgi:hypothetical protein